MGERSANIVAVILAAGSARRFGSDKRLYLIDGVAMLTRTILAFRRVFDAVRVVIRPGEPDIADLVATAGGSVVEALDAEAGQSRSLAAGVEASRDADGLVVGLADMPFVQEETLRSIARTMVDHPGFVVRPRHGGRLGNPVGFPTSMFDALTRIDADRGARELLAGSDRVLVLDVDDTGVLVDIDTPR